MTAQISNIFPKVEIALELEPEELAVPLLELLSKMEEEGQNRQMHLGNILLPQNLKEYAGKHFDAFCKVITEAWMWLLHEGMVAPNYLLGSDWIFITRRGHEFREHSDIGKFKAAKMLPYETLDPNLAAKVRPPFIRGDFDSAVLEAFKEVEIRVRNLSGLGADVFGINLMRKAFKPGEGLLIDDQQHPAEQQGISDIFAGSIASFKNPSSHRDVNRTDPVEAMELIGLADLLLRIANRRKAKTEA